MTAVAQRETITAQEEASQRLRWERWQTRNELSDRRSGLQARVVGAIVFAVIVANLLMQWLFSTRT